MATTLELPLDLMPKVLTYRDELPDFINQALDASLGCWQRCDITRAIAWGRQAQTYARTNGRSVSECVASIWLTDLHFEAGQPGPATECCQEAISALRLQPTYKYRDHIEGVIYYLRGLLYHASGSSAKALADYQWALASLERARDRWSSVARNKTQANRCAKTIKWINALCRCLASVLSPAGNGKTMCLTVIGRQDYELVRLELEDGLFPLTIEIGDEPYRMYNPGNGVALKNRLDVPWNARHFARLVSKNRGAGQASKEGDYVLVKRGVKEPDGPGMQWDDGQEDWKYGAFIRDSETGRIRFQPLAPIVIGNEPEEDGVGNSGSTLGEEDIKCRQAGLVRALLKPIEPPPSPPPSSGAPAGPPEIPEDARLLYSQLLQMVGGDESTANRLIEYERRQTPDASLSVLIERAIARLEHDRQ